MQSKIITLASIITVGLSGAALAEGQHGAGDQSKKSKPITIQLKDAGGRSIGNAVMMRSPTGISFRVDLKNLPPGTHAVMLHEVGKCEAPDFKTAGGQLDSPPMGEGGPDKSGGADRPRVSVELSDITTDEKGNARTTLMLSDASMYEMLVADDGSALVIHAGPEPADDGSGRIACGVISAGKK
jgi:Cu-Zn family superoxide dismutase